MSSPRKAVWWFAWRPVRTADTNRILWLRKVYREWWYDRLYFENPTQPTVIKLKEKLWAFHITRLNSSVEWSALNTDKAHHQTKRGGSKPEQNSWHGNIATYGAGTGRAERRLRYDPTNICRRRLWRMWHNDFMDGKAWYWLPNSVVKETIDLAIFAW